MRLILCDTAPEALAAWTAQFAKRPEVEVRQAPVLDGPAEAVLLPGSSFGFLDSGLGLEVLERHGWAVEEELRRRVRSEHDGELLVGQAIVLRLPALPKTLVYAPIFRVPRHIEGTVNVFLAVRGALLALKKDPGSPPADSLGVPALGVGPPGGLDPRVSARQMRYAYEIFTGQRGLGDKNLTQQIRRERKLISVPGAGKETDGEGEG
ncbi:MAG: hypothetical protein HY721_19100 [Planctomycetes bacterium]|nr:hypothetical protein [Planctomycetota bacterium]